MTDKEIKALEDKAATLEAANTKLKNENEALKTEKVQSAEVIQELNEQLTAQEIKGKSKFTQVKVGKETFEIRAGKVKLPSALQKQFGVAAELKDSELADKKNAKLLEALLEKQVGYLVNVGK